MKRLSASIIALLLVMPHLAPAGESSPPQASDQGFMLGRFRVPADSPIARGEHPRLLFTRKDVPRIRARAKLPAVQQDIALMENLIAKHGAGRLSATSAAVLYTLTSKEQYKQVALTKLAASDAGAYVQDSGLYAYDILYDELSPAQRTGFEQKALKTVQGQWNYGNRLSYALGIFGHVQDPAVVRAINDRHQAETFQTWNQTGQLNWWAGARGGDTRSFHYIHQNTMSPWANATMCWRHATGQDVWTDATWAKYMPAYYIYHLEPGLRYTIHVGINCNPPASPHDNSDAYFSFLASRWHNGPAQWYMENIVHRPSTRSRDYCVLPRFWGRLLWKDPDLDPVAPERIPPDRYFDRMGFVSMRSSWKPAATMAHFQSGPFEVWDGPWGRNNADNNSFILLSRGGVLAADTGTRWANNQSPSRHMQEYFNQTVAHNSITVGDEDIHVRDKGIYAVRGGQVVPAQKAWIERRGENDPKAVLFGENQRDKKAGQILAYASSPAWVYAVGDATRSYSPDYVDCFVRHFLYLRPDLFVIFDRVRTVKPDQPVRWLLHTMEKPTCVDGAMTGTKPGYFRAEGARLAATHHEGKLFCCTLLPRGNARQIDVIGGQDHRFEVNGINRDMDKAWYDKVIGKHWDAWTTRNHFASWRVEVMPTAKTREHLLLHVLECAGSDQAAMSTCELVESQTEVGVDLVVKGIPYQVRFRADAKPGGTIRVGPSAPRPLPTGIEDNHARWQADPRYRFWMTSPLMRAWIGATEQDAYQAMK